MMWQTVRASNGGFGGCAAYCSNEVMLNHRPSISGTVDRNLFKPEQRGLGSMRIIRDPPILPDCLPERPRGNEMVFPAETA